MESNQTSNEPTEAQAQSNQTSTESNTSQSQSTPAPETHKSTKAPWTVAAITSVLVIAGIAFGIYGSIDSNNKSAEIDNLKSKMAIQKEEISDKTIYDKSDTENTDEGASKESKSISYKDERSFHITVKDKDDGNYNITQSFSARSFPNDLENEYLKMYTYSSNGELKCEVYKYNTSKDMSEGNTNRERIKDCDLSAHTGKVIDIVDGYMGNGYENLILILNSEGEVEYLNNEGDDYLVLKKLNLSKKVARLYGDKMISSTYVDEDGNQYPGGGAEVMIRYVDGSFDRMINYFNS